MLGLIYLLLSILSVVIVFIALEYYEQEVELSMLLCLMAVAFCAGPIALVIILFILMKEKLFPVIKNFLKKFCHLDKTIKFGKLKLKDKIK